MRQYLIRGFVWIFSFIVISCAAVDENMESEKVVYKEKGRAALGVVIKDVDTEELEELKLDGGAEIVEVLEDTEAESIGLREHDIIINFDGTLVDNAKMLKNKVAKIKEEKKVELQVIRNGNVKTLQANLTPMEPRDIRVDFDGKDIHLKHLEKLPKVFNKHFHFFGSEKGGYLGVYAENLSQQLKEYFEVENGVLIEKVIEDSPAEKAGLKAGDVIIKIEEKKVEDYSDLVRTLNYYDPEDEIKIYYTRKGEEKSTKVELSEKPGRDKHAKWMDDHDVFFNMDEDFGHRLKVKLDKNLGEVEEKLKEIEIDIEMYII